MAWSRRPLGCGCVRPLGTAPTLHFRVCRGGAGGSTRAAAPRGFPQTRKTQAESCRAVLVEERRPPWPSPPGRYRSWAHAQELRSPEPSPGPLWEPRAAGFHGETHEGYEASLASPDPRVQLVNLRCSASTSGPVPGTVASAPGQASGLGFPLQGSWPAGARKDGLGELGPGSWAEKTPCSGFL